MAKKTRKVIKQESQQRAIQQALNNVSTAQAVATAKQAAESAAPGAPAKSARPVVASSDDYAYVKRDLRRIGLLAGSFTAILIILSFFIR